MGAFMGRMMDGMPAENAQIELPEDFGATYME